MTAKTARKQVLAMDRQIVGALIFLLFLYAFVTLKTFILMPESDREGQQPFFEMSHGEGTHVLSNYHAPDPAIDDIIHTFPVHVDNDVEVIDHPGLAFADKTAQHQELPPKLTVPRFWNPRAYGEVRKFLGNYGETLITPEEAAQIGSWYQGMETIFASVASYRDPECTPTVESIYARAKYPERIRVAIVMQRSDGDPICAQPEKPCQEDPTQTLCKYKHLIDVYEMDAQLAVGPVFARHLGHRLYRGEYFAMQVDSHVRFTKNWDDEIVSQWKSAKNEMGVLTTYLSDIIGSIDPVTHENIHPGRPIMCVSDYEGQGTLKHLRHGQQPEGPAGIHGEPTLHPFWAAGFSFARGHFVVQVPYDQYLPMVFQGEEINMGLRGFTYGYDYYAPERSVCFHMYAIKENKEKRREIKLFWENAPIYRGAGMTAMQRLNGIIGMLPKEQTYFNREEKQYGLGKARKPEKFYSTFGIHTDTQKVEGRLCRFVGKPMMKEFKPHLRENRMGINYDEITFEWKDPIPGGRKAEQDKGVKARVQQLTDRLKNKI